MRLSILMAALCGVLCLALPARADGEVHKIMTAADKQRLAAYGDTRKAAIAESRKGLPDEIRILDAVLAKPFRSFAGFDMVGNWQCRTIKVGGLGYLVVYDWFKCRVTDDGSGWKLLKLTGSQRTSGRFYDENDKRLIYLGSFFVNDDPVKPYGSGTDTDQVGYAFRTGDKEWRIELPAPRFESVLDILEFRK